MHVDPWTRRRPALVLSIAHAPPTTNATSLGRHGRQGEHHPPRRPEKSDPGPIVIWRGFRTHMAALARAVACPVSAYPSSERAMFPSPLPVLDMEIQVDSGVVSTRSLCESCAYGPRTRGTTHSPVRYWPPLDLAITETRALPSTFSQSRLVSWAVSIAPRRPRPRRRPRLIL
jgi:hypothetical protein